MVELLDQDERPSFIIDVKDSANFLPGVLCVVFSNVSLNADEGLLDMVTGRVDQVSPGVAVFRQFTEFKAWATSFVQNHESLDISLPSFVYGGFTWSCKTLRKRLRLIAGISNTTATSQRSGSSPAALASLTPTSLDALRAKTATIVEESPRLSAEAQDIDTADYFHHGKPSTRPVHLTRQGARLPSSQPDPASDVAEKASSNGQATTSLPENDENRTSLATTFDEDTITASASNERLATHTGWGTNAADAAFFDWTRAAQSSSIPRHVQLVRSINWAATPLGPVDDWPSSLRTLFNFVMASPHATAIVSRNPYSPRPQSTDGM